MWNTADETNDTVICDEKREIFICRSLLTQDGSLYGSIDDQNNNDNSSNSNSSNHKNHVERKMSIATPPTISGSRSWSSAEGSTTSHTSLTSLAEVQGMDKLRAKCNTKRCPFKFSLQPLAFSLGCICAIASASIDLKEALYWGDDECDDDDDGDDDSSDDDWEDDAYGKTPLEVWNLSKNLSIASTLFYLLDTVIQTGYFRRLLFHDYEKEVFPFTPIFGTAAFFDLMSSLFDDDYMPWPGWWFELCSVTLFFISAAGNLYYNYNEYELYHGKRYYYYQENRFAMFGDIFFLTGCMIDCFVGYCDNPLVYCAAGWIQVCCMSLISALMWFTDSVLYFFAHGIDNDDDSSSSSSSSSYDPLLEDDDVDDDVCCAPTRSNLVGQFEAVLQVDGRNNSNDDDDACCDARTHLLRPTAI